MTDQSSTPKPARHRDEAMGARIAEARKAAGFSGFAFAVAIGAHPSQLSRWEAGDVPKVDALRAIAAHAGVSLDHLINGPANDTGAPDEAA